MSDIDRDYTSETMEKISQAIDSYMGTAEDEFNTVKKFFKKLFERGGAEKYEDFIFEMSWDRKTVIDKIYDMLEVIRDEEERYKGYFSGIKDEIAELSRRFDNLAAAVSFEGFSKPVDFYRLALGNQEKVQKFMEAKSEKIMEKAPKDWTDEEYEIVAYAYITSTDGKFKQNVINCFYTDSTDEHIIDNRRIKADEKINLRYFDRDQKSWDKFAKIATGYYAYEYGVYLNSNPDDKEQRRKFETAMENYLVIKNYNSDEYSSLLSNQGKPVSYEDGSFHCNIAKYDKVEITDKGVALGDHGPQMYNYLNYNNMLDILSNDSSFSISKVLSGEEAENYIYKKIKEGTYETESPIDRLVDKLISEGIGIGLSALDYMIPGAGTVANKVLDVNMEVESEKSAEIENKKRYEMSTIGQLANSFGIGVAFTSGGFVLYNTPTSVKKLNDLINILKNYPDTYEKLGGDKLTVHSFVNGTMDLNMLVNELSFLGLLGMR